MAGGFSCRPWDICARPSTAAAIGKRNSGIWSGFYALADLVREVYPRALCLGAGGCRRCGECAFPEPCRFPEKAVSSMEGYGLFVTQVCRDVGVAYHHGERTITYSACILY